MHPNIIHLRIPFSIFLMPVFLFAWSQQAEIEWVSMVICFLVLHFLVYPSSNGYNSYMDNDQGSIGGIKSPPKVPKSMLHLSLVLDLVAIGVAVLFLGKWISVLLASYILASRAYSYRRIRIKKYPVLGFLHVAFFQGVVIYWLSKLAMGYPLLLDFGGFLSLLISFLLVGAGYPLTQVYQHKQDKEDGVKTISMLLGIRGTFVFSTIMFAVLGVAMGVYQLFVKESWVNALLFYVCLSPVLVYFTIWSNKVKQNESEANFENTMRMNKIGAWAVNLFFILLIIKNYL